jgi:long-chain acyl-CoA synthetase
MSDIATPAHQLPQLADLIAATDSLTGPGSPFETAVEDVRGHSMLVFRNRPANLRDVLASSFAHGERNAMVFGDGRRITFSELESSVASVAAWLRNEHGITKGDRVAICGANGVGWILSFWACLSIGAVTVAMNGWWTELEMEHALELTEPKLLLIDTKRAERLGHAHGVPQIDIDTEIDSMIAYDPEAKLADIPIDEDDAAILIFTSGTTGRPKAAVLSHRSVIAYSMGQNFIGARGMAMAGRTPTGAPPPTRLAVFPLFHVSGLGATVNGIHTGSTTVWHLGRFDEQKVIDLTLNEGINVWGGTGTHLVRLLAHPDSEKIPVGQIVSVGMGGSATTPSIINRVDTRFPHLANTMATGYGSTETGSLISFAPNWMLTASPSCVGMPLPTIEVRVTDEQGNELPEGEEGNLCVRSPLLMTEYWRHDTANAEAFLPDRWYITGDFGRMEGGTIYMASRRRDLIIRGGENIYPFEIENRLDEHPSVIEAAVIGVDHEILGQEVKAIIVIAEGSTISDEELRSFCGETLASYKIPAFIETRTEPFPRNASGKVLKHVLAGEGEQTFVED